MRLFDRQRRYAAHPDPAAAAANFVALVIAWNGAFYPLYIMFLLGRVSAPALLTLPATPLFFAIPWLMRRHSAAGRVALVLLGTANTLWCTEIFGAQSGVGLFLLPCIGLAALLYRPSERPLLLLAVGLPIVAHFIVLRVPGPSVISLASESMVSFWDINAASVVFLSGLIALRFASLMAYLGVRAAIPSDLAK